MTNNFFVLTFILFSVIALLYSSIGHAGASGYLAIMALLSFAPDSIKPTSLILNIVVASIASYKFINESYFDKNIFSFIITALPMAFIGGYVAIPPKYFKLIAGIFLIISAIILFVKEFIKTEKNTTQSLPLIWKLSLGAIIGFVSGLIGVGGGIFLTPILILTNQTSLKKASGISALFILCNSIAGLVGHVTAFNKIDSNIFYWIIAVIFGGLIGSYLGTKIFNNKIIIGCLFLILISAGLKFLIIDF